MSTESLAEHIQHEVISLAHSKQPVENTFRQQIQGLLDTAQQVAESRDDIGAQAADAMFASLETTLRTLLTTRHEHHSGYEAMGALCRELPEDGADVTPEDVLTHFAKATKAAGVGKTRAADDTLFANDPSLKKLGQVATPGAGPSGGDGLGDDDIEMVQAARTVFKCPITQMDMTEKGPMRPMRSKVCNAAACVWSHKGITEYLKKSTKSCPSSGCSQMISIANLEDDREVAKELRKAAQSR